MRHEEEYFLKNFLENLVKYQEEKYQYEPLKITFYLSTPIALNHPWMYFDSLIMQLMLRKILDRDYYLLPAKFPLHKLLNILKYQSSPIKRTKNLYHSSASILDCSDYYLEKIYKRFEDRWSSKKVKKVRLGSGYFKNYAIQHIYIPTRTVIFYVNGSYNKLSDLCNLVYGLGDNVRIGWGAVKDYSIERISEDYSIVFNKIAMRPIPINLLQDTDKKVKVAWKPPYWSSDNISICAPPGAKVTLKNE